MAWFSFRAYSADAIRGLKARVDGGIYVSGGGTLVRALLADGLIDEPHLFVFPLALRGCQHQLGEPVHRAITEAARY